MEQILSSKTAFFAIVPTFIAGITLMAIGFIEWGRVCFVIASAFLFLFLLFRRQHIDIMGIKCSVSQDVIMGYFHPMAVNGFIDIRHARDLINCRLMVVKNKQEYPLADGLSLGDEIRGTKWFVFHIPLEEEYRGQLLDWGLVYIKIGESLWYTPPFPIKTQTQNNEGWFKEMMKKLTPKTRRIKDEGDITKKQLHELLDKASQPIKKSEKGKS